MRTDTVVDSTTARLYDRQRALLREAADYRLAAAMLRRWRAGRRLRRETRTFAAALRAATGPSQRGELIALATRDRRGWRGVTLLVTVHRGPRTTPYGMRCRYWRA